jgi:2',3'-cyclic-nucleotide 2'-phosphodiesterase (5'-nucleotidase family)
MNKLAILSLVLLLAACGGEAEQQPVQETGGLTFIHINDTYRVGDVEDGKKGGFGRVVTVVRGLQQQGRDVRITHAGDFLFPSLESQLWNGEQMVDAINFLDGIAPVYLVPGNHEFDARVADHLANAVAGASFDWIADNYELQTGRPEVDAALHRGFMIEHQGRKIGVLGLMMHFEDGGNDRDYLFVDRDYAGVAERAIESFEQSGADMIFAITHLRMSNDRKVAALRESHPTLMFAVGGHEHEPQHSALRDVSAAIMKGASNARAIWQIDVDFDESGTPSITTKILQMDETVEPDPEYLTLQNKWRDRLLAIYPFLTARVGAAALPLDARETVIRNQETSWANFIVDQMRMAFGREPADFAFINTGTIRIDDFIQDDILFEDIGRTFGFSSYLRYLQLSGAEFKALMEAGYRGEGESQGYYPAISGFRVCVDRKRPEFDRIVSLQVPGDDGWAEIDSERLYDVVVPDYLYRGGDGYRVPQDRPASKRGSELKYLVLDAILRAQSEGRAVGEPVDKANPRYVEIGPSKTNCW